MTILEDLGGPDGPVHNIAWIDDENIDNLLTRSPAGTRFIFKKKEPASLDDGKAWLEKFRGRSLR